MVNGEDEKGTLHEPPEFRSFQKISRLNRDIIITEKIDGTNAQIYVCDNGVIMAGSRNRWLTVEQDNFGFARWASDHYDELRMLGPGRHFGEWWGSGIQRKYGLSDKRFSLFNVSRWTENPPPPCCHLVPVLYHGPFDHDKITDSLERLSREGSLASPGFTEPEGVIIFHEASGISFKVTLFGDAEHKGTAT